MLIKFHEVANIFPLDEEHLDELAEDIREKGQLVPIELLGGKIIDGRRRWLACQKAGVTPATLEIETDDPIAHVLSLNLQRRQLTVSQRAMVGDEAREMYEKAAVRRMSEGGKEAGRGHPKKGERNSSHPFRVPQSRDQIGAAVGVSGDSIDRARTVRKAGIPQVAEAVRAGKLSVNKAAPIAKLPTSEQKAVLEKALQPRSRSPSNRKRQPATTKAPVEKGKKNGVGVRRANEAINALSRIPKNDPLRERGFQIVMDWIKSNRNQ
jgi:ParB-like chromosome segregation protein Spo0J